MSAQVTEAHQKLAYELMQMDDRLSAFANRTAAQLIADSEAKAVGPHAHVAAQLAAVLTECGAPEFANSEHALQWAKGIAQLRAERDALLEIAWLDTPDEPHENVGQWRVEFCNGWERRSVCAQLRAEVERITEDNTQLHASFVHHQARAERAEADTYRIKLAAIGAIEAASKYSATGNYEEADLVRQDFADKETIEVFEKFRARANRTEKAEAELAKERARLKEMAAELAHCAGYIASVRTDRQITWHEELYALQTVEWAEGAVEIAEKANAVLEAHDAAMKEDRT